MEQFFTSARGHALVAVVFLLGMLAGYVYDGMAFVQGWGGGFAAVIATAYLVVKSRGYWAWMIVNAGLWTYLFFDFDLPLLAWLQVAFLIFASYGALQWTLYRFRIGVNFRIRADVFGSVLALGVFLIAAYAYFPDGAVTWRWYAEAGSVALAIAAMWMDAFRYRANWIAWTLSNCLSGPLFLVLALEGQPLWGPFLTIFLYQALNVVGWIRWGRDERLLREASGMGIRRDVFDPNDLPLTGPKLELEDDRGTVGAHRYEGSRG